MLLQYIKHQWPEHFEAHASALRDSLIDGMSFGSRPTASSVINRRSVSFPPQSGGTFDPGVLRLLRFSLQDATDGGSSGWLDGERMRLAFVYHNKGTTSEMRGLAGGLVVQAVSSICQRRGGDGFTRLWKMCANLLMSAPRGKTGK